MLSNAFMKWSSLGLVCVCVCVMCVYVCVSLGMTLNLYSLNLVFLLDLFTKT